MATLLQQEQEHERGQYADMAHVFFFSSDIGTRRICLQETHRIIVESRQLVPHGTLSR